jgi:HEAT repeat protein
MPGFRTIIAQIGLPIFLLTAVPDPGRGQQHQSAAELLEKFKGTGIFWQQFEVAKKIVEVRDTSILPQLKPWLSHEDRHLRGNAAFIFAALGDRRGFDVITAILDDVSERPEGQGTVAGRWTLRGQITADRYYAVHLLGELKDPQAVPVLVALLRDEEVNYKVPWALGEIGGKAAVRGLMEALRENSPDVRVIAIESLDKLHAKDALPRLRSLLDDNARSGFGEQVSVAEAARKAIINLERSPDSVQ